MSKYNIEVIRLARSAVGGTSYTGAFLLVDNEAKVSFDNGKTIQVASATLAGEVESITYSGAQIAKIKNTQGQPREALVEGSIKVGDDYKACKIQWSAGHRSSVAAAFAALWTELIAQGGEEITNRQNPKATKVVGGLVNSAPQANKLSELEQIIKSQAVQMQMLMDLLAAKTVKAVDPVVFEEPTDEDLLAEEAQIEEMLENEELLEAPVEDELIKLIAEQAADSKKTVVKKGRR
jgi:hypothetical protein